MLVIDDANLLVVLAGEITEGTAGAVRAGEAFTTGTWYWRAARAILDPAGPGALNRVLLSLPEPQQEAVRALLANLPPHVRIVGPRRLVPLMASLRPPRRLNLLTSEAVATALLLDATIVASTESELLTETCTAFGINSQIDGL